MMKPLCQLMPLMLKSMYRAHVVARIEYSHWDSLESSEASHHVIRNLIQLTYYINAYPRSHTPTCVFYEAGIDVYINIHLCLIMKGTSLCGADDKHRKLKLH